LIPDVLLLPLARIGAAVLPVRLREAVRDWDGLDGPAREAARGELEGMAGAVAAGRG
jgi:hypothetical protein